MLARRSRLWSAALGALLAASPLTFAQSPAPQAGMPQQQPGVEVLARGAVHEAYATTNEFPTPGGIVPKVPPQLIEELPPDQRPEGDNVQWIPGYWSWDEERNDFIWISGFWRVAPPGRVWVPGSWRETRGGWQWASGFWQAAAQPVQNIEFLPPPPQPLEVAPQVPAPNPASYYVPGSWVYRERYVWRPGFWIDHRPGWMWVPAHYRWSPAGYVFVEGYWDLPIHERGVLFAPVAFQPAIIARPTFVYTPTYVVAQPAMVSSLFIRRGYGSYYFGDYFEQRYLSIGFSAWCGNVRGTSFALSIGFGRATTYDPNWAYFQIHHRTNPTFVTGVGDLYAARFRGEAPRPPRTLVQQTTVVNNITNVTNVTNVTNNVTNITNNNVTNINRNAQNLTMVAPLRQVGTYSPNVKLQAVQQDERNREVQLIKQTQTVAAQRAKLENTLVDRQMVPQANEKPRQVKLDIPQPVVARAQAPVSKLPPPPTPTNNTTTELRPKPTAPTPVVGNPPLNKPTVPTTPAVPPKPEMKPTTPVAPSKPTTPVVPPVGNPLPKPSDPKPVTPPAPPMNKPTTPAVPVVPPMNKPTVPAVPPKVEAPKPVVPPVNKPTVPAIPPMPPKMEAPKPVTPPAPPVNKPTGPVLPPANPPKVEAPKAPAIPAPPAIPMKPVVPPAPPVGKPTAPATPPLPPGGKPTAPTTKPTAPPTKPTEPMKKPGGE